MANLLHLHLNSSAPAKEANVKSVCNSLKKKLQETHPELNVANELKTINNGFQITCTGWVFDIVRYQKWVRLDILKSGEKQAKFYKTNAPEVRDVVTLFLSKINEALAKEAVEQPAETAEPVKAVTPLKWVAEDGVSGTSGWYAYLDNPDGTSERLAHVATCGMIWFEDKDIAQLDRIKINDKAARIYREWQQGYAKADDSEKEATFIKPNLTMQDNMAMSRDLKKVEMREKQPEKYKKYPTREEWLETWKNEMFELLKQDGYKYPTEISTNSNKRKGERIMKTLKMNSAKVEREPGEPNPFYPDSELALPVTTEEVATALAEALSRDADTGQLVIKAPENEDPKAPYLIYVTAAGYNDNALIADGDGNANVYVTLVNGNYDQTAEQKMKLFEVVDYIESMVEMPMNSNRKTYLRRKLDAMKGLNCGAQVDHRNDWIFEVSGKELKGYFYNPYDYENDKPSTEFKGQVRRYLEDGSHKDTYFDCEAKDHTDLVKKVEAEYNVSGLSVRRVGNGPATSEDVDWRDYTNLNSSRYRRNRGRLNSAKLPVGATSKSEVDNEFMNDVDSILSLSTGDTIDVDAAYLAYNPETKELILSDESETTLDSGYVIIGKFTPDSDALAQIVGKEPELEPGEEMPEDENVEPESEPLDDAEPVRDSHVPAPEEDEEPASEGGIF